MEEGLWMQTPSVGGTSLIRMCYGGLWVFGLPVLDRSLVYNWEERLDGEEVVYLPLPKDPIQLQVVEEDIPESLPALRQWVQSVHGCGKITVSAGSVILLFHQPNRGLKEAMCTGKLFATPEFERFVAQQLKPLDRHLNGARFLGAYEGEWRPSPLDHLNKEPLLKCYKIVRPEGLAAFEDNIDHCCQINNWINKCLKLEFGHENVLTHFVSSKLPGFSPLDNSDSSHYEDLNWTLAEEMVRDGLLEKKDEKYCLKHNQRPGFVVMVHAPEMLDDAVAATKNVFSRIVEVEKTDIAPLLSFHEVRVVSRSADFSEPLSPQVRAVKIECTQVDDLYTWLRGAPHLEVLYMIKVRVMDPANVAEVLNDTGSFPRLRYVHVATATGAHGEPTATVVEAIQHSVRDAAQLAKIVSSYESSPYEVTTVLQIFASWYLRHSQRLIEQLLADNK